MYGKTPSPQEQKKVILLFHSCLIIYVRVIEIQGYAYHFLLYQGHCYGRMAISGQTGNQEYYKQILKKLCECVGKNCPDCKRMATFAPKQCTFP